ncbi:zinc-binding dehydrogenase [Patescibacteria group bacterium]|nr:zinc-binding dehydrogenase [Patescibacteria group bacterium]MBU0963545.1 zinc-binding dehydrogenase [Patescibacteria group bacterium]
MQAFIIDKNDDWEKTKGLKKVEVPEPKLDENNNPEHALWTIVKVLRAGVCGSDKGIWFRKAFKDMIFDSLSKEGKDQRIIGHEFFGEVITTGSQVENQFGIKKGDTVSAESHITCGQCYQCLHNEHHVCTNEKILGIGINGCFAKYILIPALILRPTNPKIVRPEIASIQEPFGNAVHASTRVDLKNKRVAVLGCGPIGLMCILIAKATGASQITAIDPNDHKLKLARQFGADQTIQTVRQPNQGYDENVIKKVTEATDDIGADVVLEMTGYPSSLNTAVKAVRRGGHIILFGLCSGDMTIKDFDRMIIRGITLHSIIGRRIYDNWKTTKQLLENTANNVQKHLWEGLLKNGQGTILPFSKITSEDFEKAMLNNPKVVLNLEE